MSVILSASLSTLLMKLGMLAVSEEKERNNFNDFPHRYDFKPTKEVPVYHTGACRLSASPVG